MDRLWRVGGRAVAAAALLLSGARARSHEVGSSEERVFRLFNDAPDGAHVPVWTVMQSGSLGAVFVVSGELYRRGSSRSAATSLVAGVIVWGGVKLVKPLVGRGRPERHLDDVSVRGPAQTGLGYPSGHGAVSLTLAIIATGDRHPAVRAVAVAVAAATGGARMYVGAHLPLDVIGGFAIGALCGEAARAVQRAGQAGCAMTAVASADPLSA